MNFQQFWQHISNLGPGWHHIPGAQQYRYRRIVEDGEEKLIFSSENAQNDYRILLPKVQEYFDYLSAPDADVAWFKRNRSAWFVRVYNDVVGHQ
jgi:hypothetical protein